MGRPASSCRGFFVSVHGLCVYKSAVYEGGCVYTHSNPHITTHISTQLNSQLLQMSASLATIAVPESQRAAIITAFNAPYTISTSHPVPSPSMLASNQCLVKMLVSGCCHSDMHIRKGEWRGTTTEPPLIGGHEGVGIIVALGESSAQGVKGTDGSVRVGDRVGVKWTVDACGMCEHCRTGFDSRTSSSVLTRTSSDQY